MAGWSFLAFPVLDSPAGDHGSMAAHCKQSEVNNSRIPSNISWIKYVRFSFLYYPDFPSSSCLPVIRRCSDDFRVFPNLITVTLSLDRYAFTPIVDFGDDDEDEDNMTLSDAFGECRKSSVTAVILFYVAQWFWEFASPQPIWHQTKTIHNLFTCFLYAWLVPVMVICFEISLVHCVIVVCGGRLSGVIFRALK